MRRIILGLLLIVGAGAVILTGATGAFFSDTETSTGNTFAAGAINLQVDNESYYNGNKCAENPLAGEAHPNEPYFIWQGNAPYPVPGTPCTISWELDDLDNGRLFFNFTDLKPDDESEDTISLHVGTNDAYACMDVTLTSNDDNSSTEPELDTPDQPEDINNTWDGELAQNLEFFWWADDGDNVYEEGENSISDGVQALYDLATTSPFSVALADSQNNVWGDTGPIPGDKIVYIAKAWCFGNLALAPVAAGQGVNPSVDSGTTCDGTSLNNLTQTDGVTLDVAFRAIQARHNTDFLCKGPDEEPRTAKITVTKLITNDNGGNNAIADFQLFVNNGSVVTNVTSGVETTVSAGSYTVGETGVSGYVATIGGDCALDGSITLNSGDVKSCTITNNDQEAHITLVKNVINNSGGTATPVEFGLKIDGVTVSHNSSVTVTANTAHTINETGKAGYTFVSITGSPECPSVLGGTATLDEGESITCTITNDDNSLPVSIFSDGFGAGSTVSDIADWEETGDDSTPDTRAREGSGGAENAASPDGARFAEINGGEWICRSVNASAHNTLALKYYWRGDEEAEDGESGIAEYATGGTCDSPTGLTTLTSHELDDTDNNINEPWSSQQTVSLPGSLDGTTFLLRFRNAANLASEDFRIDGVNLTGIPN